MTSYLFEFIQNGISNGSFRHFYTEIICYSSANDGKGIGLREFSATFHCFGVCQERYFFSGVVGSGIGRIVSMVCGDNEKVVFTQSIKKDSQVYIEFLNLLCVA